MSEDIQKEKMISKKRIIDLLIKIFAFFGIEISRGKRHPVHLNRRFFLWILGFFIFLILLTIFMYNYSTHPSFCRSCHIMEPYYQAWATSNHKGKAACVDCHYPPSTTFSEHIWHKFQATSQVAKYITRTYSSKPFAVVQDSSCLRSGCHSERLLEGKTHTPKGVRFDHRPHLKNKRRDRKLSCTSCHSQIVIGTHIEVTYETCYLCHFKDRGVGRDFKPLGGCLGCHEIPTKDIQIGEATYNHTNFAIDREVECQNCHVDVVQGTGEAPIERCVDCHNDPERLKSYDDLVFIHEKHVSENKADCQQCHLSITHKIQTTLHPTKPVETNCALCHTDKHTGQKMMYMGIGGHGVPDLPSPMYTAQVDCVGCHLETREQDELTSALSGKTYGPTKYGCVRCHGEDYLSVYDTWQNDVKTGLARVEKKLKQAELYLKSHSREDIYGKQKEFNDAQYNFELVKQGHGIHNPDYAASLLKNAEERLDKIMK